VVVFGTDMSEQIADFLLADDGILQAVTGQKPFDIGAMAVDTALRAVKERRSPSRWRCPARSSRVPKRDEVLKHREYLRSLTH